jgi:hypothetical protein
MVKVKTYKIEGPAGEKFSCTVPQKKHEILGKKIDLDKLSIADAEYIFANSSNFLVKNTDKAEAVKKKAEKK